MFLFITKFFKSTPDSLVKELDKANSVFNKAIEGLRKIKLKSVTRGIKNTNKINKYRKENERLDILNSRIDGQINRYRSFLE